MPVRVSMIAWFEKGGHATRQFLWKRCSSMREADIGQRKVHFQQAQCARVQRQWGQGTKRQRLRAAKAMRVKKTDSNERHWPSWWIVRYLRRERVPNSRQLLKFFDRWKTNNLTNIKIKKSKFATENIVLEATNFRRHPCAVLHDKSCDGSREPHSTCRQAIDFRNQI